MLGGFLFVCLSTQVTASEPLRVDFTLLGEYHDNIAAGPVDPQSGYFVRPALEISGSDEARHYRWFVNGSFGYRKYGKDIYDPRYDGTSTAAASWIIRDSTLEWDFQYNESEQVLENEDAPVGDNVTTLRMLATGPVLNLNLSKIDHLQLSAHRQQISQERSQYYRNKYSALIQRKLSDRHNLYVRGDFRETQLWGMAPDYYTYDKLAGYRYIGERTKITIEGGKTRFKREGQDNALENDTGSFHASLALPRSRSISLQAERRFSDEATDLASLGGLPVGVEVQGAGVFADKSARVSYNANEKPFHPSLSIWAREKRYIIRIGSQRNTDEYGGRARTTFYRQGTVSVEGSFHQIRREFVDTMRIDDDRRADLWVERLMTPRLSITAGAGWFHRNSNFGTAEYTDLSVYFEFAARLR